WSYHTGARISVPTLRPYKQGSVKSYFNGTRPNADFGTDFPWGWVPGYWSPYASWNRVDINVGIGSEGFKISKKTLGYENSVWVGEWKGLKACEWAFEEPQLFWYRPFRTPKLPCSCAKIKLMPKYI
ncbi:hypothetical protein BDD12DRAFT_750433, partial [Trichophaea hybrida]